MSDIILIAALAFVYVMGAFMMWEEAVSMPRGPSPDGAWYSKEIQDFYDRSNENIRYTADMLAIWSSVILWPFLIAFGIAWHMYRARAALTQERGK